MGGGGADSKIEKSAVLQGSDVGGGWRFGGGAVEEKVDQGSEGGGGWEGVDGGGSDAGGGVGSDSKSDVGVNDVGAGDCILDGVSSRVSSGPEDSKSAKSSSSSRSAVMVGEPSLVLEVSLFITVSPISTSCLAGFCGVLFADPVAFLRRPGPITPISASKGMNFPGLNRAEVGDTVPLRRTMGDACFDNGGWIGDIFADLGVDAGVDKVGFRLESGTNDSVGVLMAGDSTISPQSSSSSAPSSVVDITCGGFAVCD